MRRYFGTDGVRGVANELLTPDFVLRLGRAIAQQLIETTLHHAPRVLIGRDTRRSGAMLETALVSGLCSMGVHATSAGIVPTPAVAYLVREGRYDLGVVISASHNPARDNGVKLIGGDGYKFPDEYEAQIEARLADAPEPFPYPPPDKIGLWQYDERESEQYLLYLLHLMRELTGEREPLRGVHIVVDCANGAASQYAPVILHELGAKVSLYGGEPDGDNINLGCGSTHLETLQRAVLETDADLGVAFDGDADRALFVDEKGDPVDGDAIMTLWAITRHRQKTLNPPIVVATEMSNLGMQRRLEEEGIELRRTKVGDRYVVEAMRATGALIGGEQSGHIIFSERATTGDGLITMLETLALYLHHQQPFSEIAHPFTPYPQKLVTVPVQDKHAWQTHAEIQSLIRQTERMLGTRGRLNIRASGTENAIRVMVEAERMELVNEAIAPLAELIRRVLG
ncbi:MAG: phosphoglucosamine mutase [Armatimonadetes bacterium CP1_7O]|jgi:phosphoglucosamine mutase|nr:MAG: phosphoglucosamine mutase [Armatimonadetes bacterium CP1_7O]RMH09842.1 MAG: phosphoglucosamine mutase [Armatimonadota bacterium]